MNDCPLCDGDTVYECGDGVVRYCACATKKWTHEVKKSLEPVFYNYPMVRIEDINLGIHPKVKSAVEYVAEWTSRPIGRLVITGGYGTGKTHMLQAIAGFLNPIALYMPAVQLENLVFEGLSRNSLGEYMGAIKRAPVLLLDDLGMEYGSSLVMAQLDGIVDFRYTLPEVFPMAVATNYSGNELQNLGRYGSRLMDRENLIYAGMPGVEDYRRGHTH